MKSQISCCLKYLSPERLVLGKVRENSPLGALQSLRFSAYHSYGTSKSLYCKQP